MKQVVGFASRIMLAVAMILVATPLAHADELSDFQQARSAYDAQNHALAVQRFEALVGGDVPRLATRALILESRKYLGAAYLFVNRRSDAEQQFERLLGEDPEYEIDPVAFPAEVIELIRAVRLRVQSTAARRNAERLAAEAEARREATDRLLRERERMDRLMALAGEERVEIQNQRWVAWIPFGAGQFQNGHTGLGYTLLVSEGLLFATTITTYIWHAALPPASELSTQGRIDARAQEEGLVYTNWISAAAFVAIAAIGIVDAQLRFVPSVWTTRQREIPPELNPTVQLGMTPTGLTLSGSF